MSPYADPAAQKAWSRRYYRENQEKIKARAVAWNRDNPERRKEIVNAWTQRNPDNARKVYLAKRDHYIERARINYLRQLKENPDHVRARQRETVARRRARVRNLFVEKIDPQLVWKRDEGICGICGDAVDPEDWHMDHIVPIARNGAHSYANVQVAHPRCNQRKAAS